jgi:hypothetical protein
VGSEHVSLECTTERGQAANAEEGDHCRPRNADSSCLRRDVREVENDPAGEHNHDDYRQPATTLLDIARACHARCLCKKGTRALAITRPRTATTVVSAPD